MHPNDAMETHSFWNFIVCSFRWKDQT